MWIYIYGSQTQDYSRRGAFKDFLQGRKSAHTYSKLHPIDTAVTL